MPAHVFKLSPHPAHADPSGSQDRPHAASRHRPVPYQRDAAVVVSLFEARNPAYLHRLPSPQPCCKPGLAVSGIAISAALHLAWLMIAPAGKIKPVTPPVPIRVEWVSLTSRAAPAAKPEPHAPRKPTKPAVKPKAKAAKPAPARPKPILSAPTKASAAVPTAAEHPETPVPSSPAAAVQAVAGPAKEAPLILPHVNADYLDNPAPRYPSASRELGEQGKVLLRAMINTSGRVAQITVRKTSGFDRLDRAALDTVKNWRFVPARRGDEVVPAWVVVPISFTLEG